MEKLDVLSEIGFGRRVAEEEVDELTRYFVETDFWRRLYTGEIDIVFGAKGSGKSALYTLLLARKAELFDQLIVLAPAENPRGAPAFRDVVADPPANERQFTDLWKLYFLSLVSDVFEEYGIDVAPARELRAALEDEGLVRRGRTLGNLLRGVIGYVRRFGQAPEAIETGVELDPITGTPTGLKGKIIFREPSAEDAKQGRVSVDQLLAKAEDALTSVRAEVWILLDRLDVAFAETPDLEENALRALFRVYLDFLQYSRIGLKIFLRTDIWRRITKGGFREASHVTRYATIAWNRRSLLYLIVRRAIANQPFQDYYGVAPEEALQTTESQEQFFYRLAPRQVDVGPNKSLTFDWVLGRTRDASGQSAPREVIHFFNSLRDVQVRRLETREAPPEGEELFVRGAFKEALAEVSRTRIEQTLYAEYPSLRQWLELLRGERTAQTRHTLASVWGTSAEKASEIASQLVEVGFFEVRGGKDNPVYWVPFLYRDGLDLVQGSAELRTSGGSEDPDQIALESFAHDED